MLRDGQVDVDASWGEVDCNAAVQANRARRGGKGEQHPDGESSPNGERHREIDRELRALARQKSRLEVDEARWLREADRHRIWRKLGFSTALEYLEDVFGYAPRTAKDRLRVAKELAELPKLEAELRDGKLPYSAARELTRVMTCATEAQWLARARGKNLRDIEELVAGHKKGDGPDDPKDPALMTRTVVLKLAPRADALLQQTRALFEAERGEHLDDEALIEAMCLRILEGGTVESIIAGTESIAATVAPVAGTTGIAETIASVAGTTGIAETIAAVAGRTGIAETIARSQRQRESPRRRPSVRRHLGPRIRSSSVRVMRARTLRSRAAATTSRSRRRSPSSRAVMPRSCARPTSWRRSRPARDGRSQRSRFRRRRVTWCGHVMRDAAGSRAVARRATSRFITSSIGRTAAVTMSGTSFCYATATTSCSTKE